MGRIIGVDYGTVRIGIAVSDPMKSMALPYKMILKEKTFDLSVQKLFEALASYEIEKIVLGLPLLLSGKSGTMAEEVKAFGKKIEEKNVPLVLWDERFTSALAERSLRDDLQMSRKKRVGKVDPIAAMFLLQSYLDQFPKNS